MGQNLKLIFNSYKSHPLKEYKRNILTAYFLYFSLLICHHLAVILNVVISAGSMLIMMEGLYNLALQQQNAHDHSLAEVHLSHIIKGSSIRGHSCLESV